MPNRVASPAIAFSLGAHIPPATARFIGRQPILDRSQQVFGYELLFRTGWENCFTGDPESVGQQMIDTTLLFGMENLVHGSKAFINCTRESLTSRYVGCLPPGTVLEVPDSVEADNELLAACHDLKLQGYAIALDHFLPSTGDNRLIELADYIKLDCRSCDAVELRCIQSLLDRSTALIAEKVETAEAFQRALDTGYAFFQGYFFARPTVLSSHEMPSNPLIYIRLLCALERSLIDSHEIEKLVNSEAPLSFRVLRFVNSSDFGTHDRISSIPQALLMIGEARLRDLVTLCAASCLRSDANQPPELILLCLHRARFCSLLAPLLGQAPREQYLIGLLSVVDALLNVPLDQVLKKLPLRPAAVDVLLSQVSLGVQAGKEIQANPLDLPLRLILLYERYDWDTCAALCTPFGITEAELTNIYLDSLRWARHQIQICDL